SRHTALRSDASAKRVVLNSPDSRSRVPVSLQAQAVDRLARTSSGIEDVLPWFGQAFSLTLLIRKRSQSMLVNVAR
ncbi:MAG TPA: hypothetical protein VMP08_09505, partial [Anaerolineae bacterium]|nr:hypothetical protein [Anaerolineae bacterium]